MGLHEYAAPEYHNAARLVDELIRMIKVLTAEKSFFRLPRVPECLDMQRYPNLNKTSRSFQCARSLLCDESLRLVIGSSEVSAIIWSSDQLHHYWQRKDDLLSSDAPHTDLSNIPRTRSVLAV